jgi:bacterioferritin (cytochrome b1)
MNTQEITERKIEEAENQLRFAQALGFESIAKDYEDDILWLKQILEDVKKVQDQIDGTGEYDDSDDIRRLPSEDMLND